MSFYPAGRAPCSPKSNNNAPFSGCFLKWAGRSFLEIEGQKGGSFDARRTPSSGLHAVVVIPIAANNFSGFMSQNAPSAPSPAINSPCEEGCCSRNYEQDATRHAALRCLLRVTADDIR
jgi:hypothetical protein